MVLVSPGSVSRTQAAVPIRRGAAPPVVNERRRRTHREWSSTLSNGQEVAEMFQRKMFHVRRSFFSSSHGRHLPKWEVGHAMIRRCAQLFAVK